MEKTFTGSRCIVTGAGSGIGHEIAQQFADRGARVAAVDAVVQSSEPCGPASRSFQVDVSSREDVQNRLGEAIGWLGGCDVLVNAAGVMREGDPLLMSEVDFDLVMDVNVKGGFLCSQVAGLAMRKEGRGAIVNITSIEAEVANPNHVAYTTSKGAMRMMTKALAVALSTDGIRVNAVGPGPTRTPMGVKTMETESERARLLNRVLRGRVGEPRDIASAVLFLASDDADFITGTTLYVDGGVLAAR